MERIKQEFTMKWNGYTAITQSIKFGNNINSTRYVTTWFLELSL